MTECNIILCGNLGHEEVDGNLYCDEHADIAREVVEYNAAMRENIRAERVEAGFADMRERQARPTPNPVDSNAAEGRETSESGTLARDKYAVLVYQAGIANVFDVQNLSTRAGQWTRPPRRLIQSDFRTCEAFARGLGAAGYIVRSMHCNMAGDITNQPWSSQLDEAPFRESMSPVTC